MTVSIVLAASVIASLLTWYFAGRRHIADTLRYGALAPAWRDGYLAGVADQEYAAAIDFSHDGYGRVSPNRANPYPGAEKQAQ